MLHVPYLSDEVINILKSHLGSRDEAVSKLNVDQVPRSLGCQGNVSEFHYSFQTYIYVLVVMAVTYVY